MQNLSKFIVNYRFKGQIDFSDFRCLFQILAVLPVFDGSFFRYHADISFISPPWFSIGHVYMSNLSPVYNTCGIFKYHWTIILTS